MKSLSGKLLASTLLAGLFTVTVPASAADAGSNWLCKSLANGINAIIDLNDVARLPQAEGLVRQMVAMGCSADLIPVIPTTPAVPL